jgi:hypothetical protein
LESVLDLVQNYTVNAHGKEIGIVVSEHGGYGARELAERLGSCGKIVAFAGDDGGMGG